MAVCSFEPLEDPRKSRYLERRRDASVFHTVPWLRALWKTYGYQHIVYTSSPPTEELSDGIVLCLSDVSGNGSEMRDCVSYGI
jgi:hypothetical protein